MHSHNLRHKPQATSHTLPSSRSCRSNSLIGLSTWLYVSKLTTPISSIDAMTMTMIDGFPFLSQTEFHAACTSLAERWRWHEYASPEDMRINLKHEVVHILYPSPSYSAFWRWICTSETREGRSPIPMTSYRLILRYPKGT